MSTETLASELLHQQKVNFKRLFIVLIVVIGLWFATIAGFMVYVSLPDEISTVVEQEADVDGGSTNTLVGGDYYSPTESD